MAAKAATKNTQAVVVKIPLALLKRLDAESKRLGMPRVFVILKILDDATQKMVKA